MISRSATTWGKNLVHIASIKNRFFERASATRSRASCPFIVNAFSTRTGLPCSRARDALAKCMG